MTTVLTNTPVRRAHIGQIVRAARTEAGLTQRQLAERLNTTQSAISRWESGNDVPRLDTLGDVLRACGIELDLAFRRHTDADRAQIRWNLQRTPDERLQGLRNMSELVQSARRVS